MTALPLEPHTEAEEATLKRIEGAESAEEATVEKVARALCDGDAEDHDTYTWDEANDELRDDYRRAACHAIGAMKGGSRAEEALARVADGWEWQAAESLSLAKERGGAPVGHYLRGQHVSLLVAARGLRAAIAAPVAGQHTTDEEANR